MIPDNVQAYIASIAELPLAERVEALNATREALHEVSPFKSEPVDFVRWVPNTLVHSNDYNPNSVAPPEMELLRLSIDADGYTQPIVSMADPDDTFEVIDGFHRHRVGKECADIQGRVHGYLPLVQIRESQADKTDRMASTIRHNRARGKHRVEAMSDIVIELKKRNWSDEKISKNLGMEPDEVLRLCQISGIADLFADEDFSQSWDVEGEITEADFIELTDDVTTYGEEAAKWRTVNTSDESRIFHTYEKWECYAAGFYNNTMPGMSKDQCQQAYAEFLSDPQRFEAALDGVVSEWKNSCEHYLTNAAMNRIAWLGQASACYAMGIPSTFRGGYSLMPKEQQDKANSIALVYLNKWLNQRGMESLSLDEAIPDRQSEIY